MNHKMDEVISFGYYQHSSIIFILF